jgi:hypothetical protein
MFSGKWIKIAKRDPSNNCRVTCGSTLMKVETFVDSKREREGYIVFYEI